MRDDDQPQSCDGGIAGGFDAHAAGKITAAPGGGGSERKENVFRNEHYQCAVVVEGAGGVFEVIAAGVPVFEGVGRLSLALG